MKHNFKQAVGALAIALLATNAVADINVGVIFSLTGPAASLGNETKKSIDLMPTMVGKEKINYIVMDDATDPTSAVKNARKLIAENNVDVLFGPNLTSGAVAIADVANEKKVPLLSQAPVEVSPEKQKWTFRVEPLAEIMVGRCVADMKAKGVKTVAFVGFSDPWGELLLKALNKTAEATSIKVVAVERFGRTDNSVTAQALKVVASKADAVFIGGAGTPAVMPHAALKERGYAGPIYHSHAVANKDFLRVGGKAIEGARLAVAPVLVAEQLPDSHPNKKAGLAFLQVLEKKYGPDSRSTFAGASWDGSLILENAFPSALKAGKPGTDEFREALRNALEKTNKVVGANGTYTTSPTDHGGYDPASAVLIEVSSGKWKLVN